MYSSLIFLCVLVSSSPSSLFSLPSYLTPYKRSKNKLSPPGTENEYDNYLGPLWLRSGEGCPIKFALVDRIANHILEPDRRETMCEKFQMVRTAFEDRGFWASSGVSHLLRIAVGLTMVLRIRFHNKSEGNFAYLIGSGLQTESISYLQFLLILGFRDRCRSCFSHRKPPPEFFPHRKP